LPGRFAAQPRLAYASRSWCTVSVGRRNNDIRGAQTHILQERRASARRGLANALAGRSGLRSANNRTRSGGRQPAVVPKNAPATGSDFRALIALATHDGPVHHGGLTPPALVLRCECLPAKKRFLRWTNACLQERRASARRGLANALAGRFDLRSANNRTRSGGRQPAVVRETHLQDDSISVRRISARGAAGVSPPWVGKRTCRTIRFAVGEQPHEERRASTRRDTEKRACNGERFSRTDYIRHARRASAPRGAYAPRSWLRVR
jgi:hypothetical protein